MIIPNEIKNIIINFLPICVECSKLVESDYTYINNYYTIFALCKCNYKYILCLHCIPNFIQNRNITYPLICRNNKCKQILFIAQTF